MSKQETVKYGEIKVKVPKPIIDFFNAYMNFIGSPDYDAEKYLSEVCEDHIKCHTEEFIEQSCRLDFYEGAKEVVNKYGLKPFIDVKAIGITQEVEAK